MVMHMPVMQAAALAETGCGSQDKAGGCADRSVDVSHTPALGACLILTVFMATLHSISCMACNMHSSHESTANSILCLCLMDHYRRKPA